MVLYIPTCVGHCRFSVTLFLFPFFSLFFCGCVQQKDITGGSQIRTIFNELLEEFTERNVTEDISDYEIDLAIRLHEGDSLPGFPSPDTFEYLILPYLKRIQSPVMECLGKHS